MASKMRCHDPIQAHPLRTSLDREHHESLLGDFGSDLCRNTGGHLHGLQTAIFVLASCT